MKTRYDAQSDALYIRLAEGRINESEEVSPGVVLDFDVDGHLLGVEVLKASERLPKGTELPVEAA